MLLFFFEPDLFLKYLGEPQENCRKHWPSNAQMPPFEALRKRPHSAQLGHFGAQKQDGRPGRPAAERWRPSERAYWPWGAALVPAGLGLGRGRPAPPCGRLASMPDPPPGGPPTNPAQRGTPGTPRCPGGVGGGKGEFQKLSRVRLSWY